MKTFRSELEKIESSDLYPFHMPGHKRVVINENLKNPYLRDITEIDGFDNLHSPSGFIKEEEEFAAKVFGAEKSFYLVNGSSCGVLASIMAVSSPSDKRLLIARNGHKSVYHAVELSGKKVDYLYPECENLYGFSKSVDPQMVKERLDQAQYEAVYITSPTYEGIVSDIKKICEIAHAKKIPVIVDEAHGAYLGIFEQEGFLPQSAVRLGADIVIQSMHKTLPSMTQTAILHTQGKLIDIEKLKYYLSVFQSSSPSYILMESISDAIHYCERNKAKLLDHYTGLLKEFYEKAKSLRNLELYHNSDFGDELKKDPGKLVIGIKEHVHYTGKQLADDLRSKFQLEMEMAEQRYVIAMTSVMDCQKGFNRLAEALVQMDDYLERFVNQNSLATAGKSSDFHFSEELKLETILSSKVAMSQDKILLPLDKTDGRISADYVYLYPPGIPLVVPGEKITEKMIQYIKDKKESGLSVLGMADVENELINCIAE